MIELDLDYEFWRLRYNAFPVFLLFFPCFPYSHFVAHILDCMHVSRESVDSVFVQLASKTALAPWSAFDAYLSQIDFLSISFFLLLPSKLTWLYSCSCHLAFLVSNVVIRNKPQLEKLKWASASTKLFSLHLCTYISIVFCN